MSQFSYFFTLFFTFFTSVHLSIFVHLFVYYLFISTILMYLQMPANLPTLTKNHRIMNHDRDLLRASNINVSCYAVNRELVWCQLCRHCHSHDKFGVMTTLDFQCTAVVEIWIIATVWYMRTILFLVCWSSPGQNGRHFADDIFERIFLNEKVRFFY